MAAQHNVILPGMDARRSLSGRVMGERIPISLEAARQGWLEDCALAGMSPQTIQGYGKQSKKLTAGEQRFEVVNDGSRSRKAVVPSSDQIPAEPSDPSGLISASQPDVTAFTSALAREIISARMKAGVALSSIRVMHAIWSSFGRWCVENHHLAENPMARIPRPKDQQKPHRYLSRDELAKVWAAACESRYPAETKLILLLLMEGLRAGELCGLRWQDVREDRIILTGKGGKVRAIPLRPMAKELLEKRRGGAGGRDSSDLSLRPSTTAAQNGSIGDGSRRRPAPSSTPTRLSLPPGPRIFKTSVGSLEQRIKRLGRASGVPMSPHTFRHTFASQQLLQGMDEGTLRQLGGWSPRSEAFQRYVRSAREDAAILRSQDFDLADRLFALDDQGKK